MRTHVVMVVKIDGGTPDEVRAYAERMVDELRGAVARGEPVTLRSDAEQVVRIYTYDPDVSRADD